MRYLIDGHQGIGDIIHILPLLDCVYENDKNADITLITASDVQRILLKKYSLRTITINEIWNKIYHESKTKYDYGFVTACICNQYKSAILLKLFGCKTIQIVKKSEKCLHRVIQNLNLVKEIGFTVKKELYPILDRKVLDQDTKYHIAICMGGLNKGNIEFKRWPYHNWVQLMNAIKKECEIYLISGEKEKKEFEIYEKEIQRKYINMMGICTVEDSMKMLSKCDLAIGNDTGMMHVAGALEVPTITLYGATNPKIVGVYSPLAKSIVSRKDCCPCYILSRKVKCKNPDCMNYISVDEVIEELKSRGICNDENKNANDTKVDKNYFRKDKCFS